MSWMSRIFTNPAEFRKFWAPLATIAVTLVVSAGFMDEQSAQLLMTQMGSIIATVVGLMIPNEAQNASISENMRDSNSHPIVGLMAIVLLLAVVQGCANTPEAQRAQIYNGLQATVMAYDLSARAYAECDAAAETPQEENECFQKKEIRGSRIGQASPFLRGAAGAAVSENGIPVDNQLARARALLLPIARELMSVATPSERTDFQWLGNR